MKSLAAVQNILSLSSFSFRAKFIVYRFIICSSKIIIELLKIAVLPNSVVNVLGGPDKGRFDVAFAVVVVQIIV